MGVLITFHFVARGMAVLWPFDAGAGLAGLSPAVRRGVGRLTAIAATEHAGSTSMIQKSSRNLEKHIAQDVLKQPGRRIEADEPIISSGLMNSFQLVDVALYVEDAFGVRIDDTELNAATFDTLEQLAGLIEAEARSRMTLGQLLRRAG